MTQVWEIQHSPHLRVRACSVDRNGASGVSFGVSLPGKDHWASYQDYEHDSWASSIWIRRTELGTCRLDGMDY